MERTEAAPGLVGAVLPAGAGHWSDPARPGNCNWMLDLDALKPNIYLHRANPPRIPWRNLIGQCPFPLADHVLFTNRYPFFDEYTVSVNGAAGMPLATFVVPGGGSITADRTVNFHMADDWAGGVSGRGRDGMEVLRSTHCLTWHEKEDTRTMILVPRAIHGYVHHSGGFEIVKNRRVRAEWEDTVEPRIVRGEELYRVMGLDLWRRVRRTLGAGADPEPTVTYCCADPEAGPTAAQQAKARELLEGWAAVFEKSRQLLDQYVGEEWPEEKKGGWTARAVELIIYPEAAWGRRAAGILWECSLDPEHGLGICIQGDGAMEAGEGDVAL